MAKHQHSGRTEHEKAAIKRFIDARRLQAQGRWRGAMYLAGYFIECKLKVRLMRIHNLDTLDQLEAYVARRKGGRTSVYTHDIGLLFELTGARQRLQGSPKRRSVLNAYNLCYKWRPSWRYSPDDGSEVECNDFFDAVTEFGRFIDRNT